MFNITYNIAKDSLSCFEIISILTTAVVGLCTIYFMRQQVNLQKQQQKAKIFNLRIEHLQSLLNIWRDYNSFIYTNKDGFATIVVQNDNYDLITMTMKKATAELLKHNLSTKNLFDSSVYNLEKALIEHLNNLIPNELELYQNIDISQNYKGLKEEFNNLYDEYEKILNKEGIA